MGRWGRGWAASAWLAVQMRQPATIAAIAFARIELKPAGAIVAYHRLSLKACIRNITSLQ